MYADPFVSSDSGHSYIRLCFRGVFVALLQELPNKSHTNHKRAKETQIHEGKI